MDGAAWFDVGGKLSSLLPDGVRYRLASVGGDVGYLVGRRSRLQAIENYAGILHLPASSREVRRVAREAMVGYAKLLVDFIHLPTRSPDQLAQMTEWTGFEYLQAGAEAGHGIIVVTPHFGNWDIAAAAAAARGLRVTAVTERYGSEGLNRRVVAARQRLGINVVPLGVSAGKAVLSALRRNEVVALVCDLPKEGRNVEVRILGQRAMVPAGPALLSLRSGAPLVPISCMRLPDDRYRIDVQPPIEFNRSGDADADVHRLAQLVMDRFEPVLRAHPEQWYLFSPMWDRAPESNPEPLPLGAG